jgi:hypothetical protein
LEVSRLRLHGLKMRGEKRAPVMTLVKRHRSTCGEEDRVLHAKKTK